MSGPSKCTMCPAQVIWAKTPRLIPVPLDVEPVAGGNIELRAGLAIVVTPEPGVRRYVSHFVTCPNREQHRRRPSARAPKLPPAPPPPATLEAVRQWREGRKEGGGDG